MEYYKLLEEKKFSKANKFLEDNENNDDIMDEIYDCCTESEYFISFIDDNNFSAAKIIYDSSHKDNDYLFTNLEDYIYDILENTKSVKIAAYFLKFIYEDIIYSEHKERFDELYERIYNLTFTDISIEIAAKKLIGN